MASLHAALKDYRLRTSREEGVQAFKVFTNRVLDGIVQQRPKTVDQLCAVDGVGGRTVSKYGQGILALTRDMRYGTAGVQQRQNQATLNFSTSRAGAAVDASLNSVLGGRHRRQRQPRQRRYGRGDQQRQRNSSTIPTIVAQNSPVGNTLLDPISRDSLNADQLVAADAVLNGGENCFLTGSAGTGKSYLLRYIIQELRRRSDEGMHSDTAAAIPVTAPTGIAATNVGGVTIHSWAGIGLGQGDPAQIVDKVMCSSTSRERWKKAEVLIIDEISMLDSQLFDLLDAIGKRVRNCPEKPFGGIQLVTCGDFFQLPPVGVGRYGKDFAFGARSWKGSGMRMLNLTQVVRQQGDPAFVRLLNNVRRGECTQEILDELNACHVSRKKPPVGPIVPTRLYCTNRDVDTENNRHLNALPDKPVRFVAKDWMTTSRNASGGGGGTSNEKVRSMIEKKCPFNLDLKLRAQVLLTTNRPKEGLVNGSRGIIVAFQNVPLGGELGHASGEDSRKMIRVPVVKFDNGVVHSCMPKIFEQSAGGGHYLKRMQVPLKLAWALTVHKSQGMSISMLDVSIADAFEFGQAYVALSRAQSMNGLWLRGPPLNPGSIKAHPTVREFYDEVDIEQP